MSRLLALYPGAWRERYEAEVRDLLVANPPTLADRADLVRGALDAWVHPQVRRRGTAAPDDRRRVPALAAPATLIVGGLLFVASGLAFGTGAWFGPAGGDHTLAFLILVLGMLTTSVAAVAAAPAGAPRRAAGLMVAGAVLDLFPWPILALGAFLWLGAAILFGAVLIARGRLVGLVPVAIGLALATFNTETDQALVAIPVGLLWILFALAQLRTTAAARAAVPTGTTNPAAGEA
jgi:hypothetical protein